MSWNAEQYLRFGGHRTRPVFDLIAGIDLMGAGVRGPRRVIDLGCGPGNSTRLLRERWPSSELTGLDNDPAMLAKARADHPSGTWVDADIGQWAQRAERGAFDIVFSNAALHWLDDHPALFAQLVAKLAPGGVLGCQMPRNFAAPSHGLLRDTMKLPQWRERLAAHADWDPVSAPDRYYEWLRPHVDRIDIWETEYLQVLSGDDPVLEWIKGSALVPVREALAADEYARFTDVYGALLRDAYPQRPDGSTLLPFRRLFIVAAVPG
jgi:trans-aconitate 2-methyltransferase